MNNKHFFCYDPNLARYIKSRGIDYVTRAKHYKSNREFTLFEASPKLTEIIQEWNIKKQ